MALSGTARAQTVTPDLFSSTRASQVTSPDSPLRRTAAEANDPLNSPKLQDNDKSRPAPSRIGQIPKYGLPAASGAADSGYDSLNRKRKKPKYYPAVHRRRWRRTRGCGFRFLRRIRRTRRRSRPPWRARWWGSRRASACGSTTIRSARSAITPAAS
jgi:hypothetical protein